MAYEFPSAYANKLRSEHVPLPQIPIANFNIPPPGFLPQNAIGTGQRDTYLSHIPPSVPPPPPMPTHLPPPLLPIFSSVPECQRPQTLEIHPTTGGPTEHLDMNLSDAQWIKEWLQKNIKSSIHLHQKPAVPLKVHEAKNLLHHCLKDLEELFILQRELKTKCQDLDSVAWEQTWNHITEVKIRINDCLIKLRDHATLDSLREILVKRNKKRARERRQRRLRQSIARESHVQRLHLHRNMDSWLKSMEEITERTKREESLKHLADQVLSEVTRRKSEARRQINMLSALQKLCSVRVHAARNRGQPVSAENTIRFSSVTEHLQKLWEEQLKGYDVEEQGLRVMLDVAVEERTKSEVSENKKILVEWETLLFGKHEECSDFYTAAEMDIESFVAVRQSWDRFVALPGAPMSSSIPMGWVIPCTPSSENWEAFLL